jgi:cytochrome c
VAVLRGPLISAGRADILDGVETTVENRNAGPVAIIAHANSHIAFKAIDLTGVRRAELAASATVAQGNVGGAIEVRLGSPTGPLLAKADVAMAQPPSGEDPATPPAPVTVVLRETQGVHDVYFVFKSDRQVRRRDTDAVVDDAVNHHVVEQVTCGSHLPFTITR